MKNFYRYELVKESGKLRHESLSLELNGSYDEKI